MFSGTPPAPAFDSQYVSQMDITPAITIFLNRPGFDDHILDSSKGNWPVWSSAMRTALGVAGLKGYITGAIPQPDDSHPFSQTNWTHNDESVQDLMRSFIGKDDEFACQHATSAPELWNVLKYRHERYNPSAAVDMQSAMSVRFNKSKSVMSTVDEIRELVHSVYLGGPPLEDCFFSACLLSAMKETLPLDYASLNHSVAAKDFSSATIINHLGIKTVQGGWGAGGEAPKYEAEQINNEQEQEKDREEAKHGQMRTEEEGVRKGSATAEERPQEPSTCMNCGGTGHTQPYCVAFDGGMMGWSFKEAREAQDAGSPMSPKLVFPPLIRPTSSDPTLQPLFESPVSSYKSFTSNLTPGEEQKGSDSELDVSDVGSAPFSSAPVSPVVDRKVLSHETDNTAHDHSSEQLEEEPESSTWSFIDNLRRRSAGLFESLVHPSETHDPESMDWDEFEKLMHEIGFESDSSGGPSVRFDPPNRAAKPIYFDRSPTLDRATLKQFGKQLKDHYGLDEELLLHPDD